MGTWLSCQRHKGHVLLFLAILALAGCGGPKAYVKPGFMEHPPERVAVLPFTITYSYDLGEGQTIPESHRVGRDVFRKTFYYALTPLGYEDVKLAEVDEKLTTAWGSIEAGAWRTASPQALGNALGVAALIYGDISRLIFFSTPLYTETSLDASLRMVEVSSGEVLWRKHIRAIERGGALLKKGQVVDFLKDQARSFNPSVKFLRVSDLAVRRAFKDFPNPPLRVDAEARDRSGITREAGQGVSLALLPLDVKHPTWRKGAELLRPDLAASLQDSSFEIVELQRIDAALKSRGWKEGESLPKDLSVVELSHELGADVVLRGTVTDWGRTYLLVQSWVKAELQLELLDAASETVIWSAKRKNTRQAGLLKGPTGYKSIVTAPMFGLKTSNLELVANHLTRSMVNDLKTSPAVLAYVTEKRP